MAYVIDDNCSCCAICVNVCPAEAISAGDGIYVIDQDKCIDCSACLRECRENAISET